MRAAVWPRWLRALFWLSFGTGVLACRGLADVSGPRPVESPVAQVELTPTQLTLAAGGSAVLLAKVRDGSAQLLTDRALTWSSSDPSVATVSVAGLVSAVRLGVAQIAVSADGRSATATVNVVARAVSGVQLTPAAPSLLVGGFVQLLAVPVDDTGVPLPARELFWVSSDPSVAFVDITGLVNGLSPGVATITASSELRSAAVGVTVLPVPVASVQITPPSASINVGQTTQLSAVSRDSAGGLLGGRVATWSTNAPGVATVSSVGVVLGITPGTATISAISAGRTSAASISVRPRPVGSVIVSPSQSALTIGQTVRLVVQITDANGTLLSGRPTTFSSSSASVAQVAADGTVTANAPGVATITVASEGQVGTATVVASPSPVSSVRISPATTSLLIGTETRLSAVALDGGGGTLPLRAVTWSSGAPSVFSIRADGTVTAIGSGTGLVFASSEGRLASATVSVRSPAAARVDVTPASVSVISGTADSLIATVRDSSGTVLTGRTVEWRSANNSVVVVAGTGRILGIAPGSAAVTATMDGVVGSSTVTTLPVPVASVTVSLTASSIIVGAVSQATAVTRDNSNNVLTGRPVAWSSSNSAVATVSGSGFVTAVAVGTITISATSEGRSGTTVLTVTAVPVASVSVSLAASSVTAGGTTQATAVTRDAASNVLSGRPITWSSSNS
uniref:Ig-like domain-containing protein n=1 Tax=Gemmatimonas sp. TaxID=1962908 RepID=UPI00356637D5